MLRFPDDCKIATDIFSVTFITAKATKTEAYWVVYYMIKEKRIGTAQIEILKLRNPFNSGRG